VKGVGFIKSLANYTQFRNYGCRIKEYIYHGMRTVCMENDIIKVVVLADKGTDIIEFVYKPLDIDFLWHSFNGVRNPADFMQTRESFGGAFLDLYEGGWQELFPNIGDPCEYKGAFLGIHGEACVLPWEYSIQQDSVDVISVKFWVRTVRTPFYLEKNFTIKLNDPCLYIDESVKNEGYTELQFMWGHHPAFGPVFLDDSCKIDVAGNVKIVTDASDSGILKEKSEFNWPVAVDKQGKNVDISTVKHPDSKEYFSCALKDFDAGAYKIVNTSMNLGFCLEWDKDMFPYIWIWEPNCANERSPWFGRNYVVGIEPWTAIPQNLASVADADRGVVIMPQETLRTSLKAYAFREELQV
jgi:galactose mutarotase-like enzyme